MRRNLHALPEDIFFIHAEELLRLYPGLTPKERGQEWKKDLYFHKRLLAGKLPCTIGGGVGQSRLCMYLLRMAHIGEIQSSIWPDDMRAACAAAGDDVDGYLALRFRHAYAMP